MSRASKVVRLSSLYYDYSMMALENCMDPDKHKIYSDKSKKYFELWSDEYLNFRKIYMRPPKGKTPLESFFKEKTVDWILSLFGYKKWTCIEDCPRNKNFKARFWSSKKTLHHEVVKVHTDGGFPFWTDVRVASWGLYIDHPIKVTHWKEL